MNTPIEKPVKQLCKRLLADSEVADGIVAVTITPNGDLNCHGAGIVSSNPELILVAAAKMISVMVHNFELKDARLSVAFDSTKGLKIDTEGQANTDPRAVVELTSYCLVELARIIAGIENMMPEPEEDDGA